MQLTAFYLVNKIPRRHIFLDVEGEQIIKIKESTAQLVDISESTCTSTSDALMGSDTLHDLPSNVDEMPEMFSSINTNGYNTDELGTLKVPPQEPFASNHISPERKRYLEDLRDLKVQSDIEFKMEYVSSFHVGSFEEWDDESIRSWLYCFRDERPSDREGP